ncbi:NAD(P)/FAD-dependent oxidoreductase [Candidatus Pelagibacter ubique]|uniref:NAD(P)/FAD-dependent oxidoreductase n=1 Tax=Pelagibacter ubique TaxID=198252 RepID=UPI0003C7DF89
MTTKFDVIIIGAGAAGMMSAIEAGKRGRKVLLVDHYKKIGEKIRISGGGRCNFTNIHTNPNKFLSQNPKFVRSALSQYTQNDFINLINKYEIKFHEKKLGQLFCDHSAQQIVETLLKECELANVTIIKKFIIKNVSKENDQYLVSTETEKYSSQSLIIATGGLSVPKIGATSFGYEIAKKFDHNIIDTLPALVPLTFNEKILEICKELTGLSVEAIVSFNKVLFQEGMLFTHRGLSGPSILQISSYWKQGDNIKVNLSPKLNVYDLLEEKRKLNPKFDILNIVSEILPKRLAQIICSENKVNGNISELSNKILKQLSENINSWLINPTGSEGYRTAEVTLGGVDTKELSSKTMMSNKHKNLFFIGEVVDVTGHLGGYNFQWAWSSGYVAGQYA